MTAARIWSAQQGGIFDWLLTGEGHGVVIARAGCGKTTTIVEAVLRWLAANPGKTVTVCAFNKRIEEELVARFIGVQGVTVKTLHALGLARVRQWWDNIRINDLKKDPISRADDLTNRVCGNRAPDAIKKLVSKLHTKGREIKPHAMKAADLMDLAERFECVPDENWEAEGFDVDFVAARAAEAMALAAKEKPVRTGIDFADMIFLPVRNGWLRGTQDLVVVDEAQDMTAAKLELARGFVKPAGGRMLLVGDDRQAIYGFVGADESGLAEFSESLGAHRMGLTVTYRCGKAIVALAAAMVPDFEAGPNNPAGEILAIPEGRLADEADLGDFILSRVNAPLVSTAMTLLRAGKRARVAGKDIGKELIELVKRLSKKARSVPEFIESVAGYEASQIARIRSKKRSEEATEKMIESLLDKTEMLRAFADDARNVKEIEERIEALFTDTGLGAAGVITLSSVHKAKGLEANRVFILADTLKNHTREEENIRYVAITRAKQTLVWVSAQGLQAGEVAPEPEKKERR
jgi:superfamily I DNA/RNA helicase